MLIWIKALSLYFWNRVCARGLLVIVNSLYLWVIWKQLTSFLIGLNLKVSILRILLWMLLPRKLDLFWINLVLGRTLEWMDLLLRLLVWERSVENRWVGVTANDGISRCSDPICVWSHPLNVSLRTRGVLGCGVLGCCIKALRRWEKSYLLAVRALGFIWLISIVGEPWNLDHVRVLLHKLWLVLFLWWLGWCKALHVLLLLLMMLLLQFHLLNDSVYIKKLYMWMRCLRISSLTCRYLTWSKMVCLIYISLIWHLLLSNWWCVSSMNRKWGWALYRLGLTNFWSIRRAKLLFFSHQIVNCSPVIV